VAQKNATNFESFAASSSFRYNKNENSKNFNDEKNNEKDSSNKFFINKIKKTSKEKYIENKFNPDHIINLGIPNNHLMTVSINNKNLDKEKKYNLNSMRTGHLKGDNIFQDHERSYNAQGH